MSEPKAYLGDGVYAELQGDDIFEELILTTENGAMANNIIYLDSEVIHALLDYLGAEFKKADQK